MSIQQITKEQLRRMGDQEGLVLQGCCGDPQEWLDGINEILTNEGIIKKGAGFENAYTFQHEGLTCMLFPFKEDENLPDPVRYDAWNLEREMFQVLNRAVEKYGLSFTECRFPKLDGSSGKRK